MKSRILQAVACVLVGILIGWWIRRPAPPVVEAAAPAVPLPSGGEVLKRAPGEPVPAATKTAAREAGGKLERVVQVVVQPRPVMPGETRQAPSFEGEKINTPPQACSCAPVRVDLGLVRMPDRTRRVVATSPDGDVVGGLDIPVEPERLPRAMPRWSALGMYGPDGYGAGVARRFGPLDVAVVGMKIDGKLAGFALVKVPLF